MNTIPYIVTDNSITVVVAGKPYTINSSNANYNVVKQRISTGDFRGIEKLFDTAQAVGAFTKGNIVVQNGQVLYRGKSVHNHVVDRILSFMREGLPYQPLVNFLEKLLQNPSQNSVAQLYAFLENGNMPLTPDGNFLSYKGVQDDFYSVNAGSLTLIKGKANSSGRIYNGVGEEIECSRNEVCDNPSQGCAQGLHIGSLNYAKGWGSRVIIVEVNPAHVVSVPKNEVEKMRCHAYKVVGEFNAPLEQGDYIARDEQYSQDEEQNEQDDWGKGYDVGKTDATKSISRNPEAAFSNVDDGTINESEFVDGYNDGYDEVMSEQVVEAQKAVKPKATISETTRRKLRRAAKKQKRGVNGRFA